MSKATKVISQWIMVVTTIVSLTNCGRATQNEEDDVLLKDPNHQQYVNQAQTNAQIWYAAFEKNVPSSRQAVNSQIPQISQAEMADRINYILSLIQNPSQASSSRGIRYGGNSWYGPYGGYGSYSYGQTYTGANYTVGGYSNPYWGTAGGGFKFSNPYNGNYGAAGVHIGIAGVCAGAGGKVYSYAGACGGCIAWSGQAYGGCI